MITYALVGGKFVLTEVFKMYIHISLIYISQKFVSAGGNKIHWFSVTFNPEGTNRRRRSELFNRFLSLFKLLKDKVSSIMCVFKLVLSVDLSPDIVMLKIFFPFDINIIFSIHSKHDMAYPLYLSVVKN